MATPRITAGQVQGNLEDHLTKHKDVYDPRSEKMHKTLYGERGTNGLAGQLDIQGVCMKQIDDRLTAIEGYLKWLVLLVMGAIIGGGLTAILK
jgi:hypothetical protein